jgi:hypothetical protein
VTPGYLGRIFLSFPPYKEVTGRHRQIEPGPPVILGLCFGFFFSNCESNFELWLPMSILCFCYFEISIRDTPAR